MKRVDIVILNWNRKNDTLECLKSLSKLNTSNFKIELVVVDNGSTDDSVDAFKKLNLSNLRIIKNQENLGFAAGNNVGIRDAIARGADYVIILNNDTIVDKNLAKEFMLAARKYPRFGELSPKIYFAKGYEFHKKRYRKSELGRVIWSAGGIIDWDNVYCTNRGVDEVDIGQYDLLEETDFATGSCAFLNVRAIRTVGFFDERYFMYLEDVDLSQRMKRNGWKVLYVPRAFLWHKVAQSSKIGGDLNDYFITRNRLLFGLKYATPKTKVALLRESLRLLIKGRKWQKKGVGDFYLLKFAKGSWKC